MPRSADLVSEATIRRRTINRRPRPPFPQPPPADFAHPSPALDLRLAELRQQNRQLREQLEQEREQFQTQRQHLLEADRQGEVVLEHYQELYDSAPVGLLTTRPSGWILEVNMSCAIIFGRAREQIIQTPLSGYFATADRKKLLTHLSLCRRCGTRISTELQLKRLDDGPLFVELVSLSRRHPLYETEVTQHILADITARKQAESLALAHEHQTRRVADLTPLLFTRCSRDLRYQFVNRACAEFLGRRREDIVGAPILEVLGEKAVKVIEPYIRRVLQGEQVQYETEIPYPTGPRFMHVVYTPERDERGSVQGWVSVISDVTEQKQLEMALELAARLPKENPAPVLRLDQAQTVTFANPAASPVLDLWGVAVGERVPEPVARLVRLALTRNEALTREIAVGRRSFQARLIPVLERNYVNLYFSDITELKAAQQALRKARDDLESQVRNRTRDLTRSNAALRHQVRQRARAIRALRQNEEQLRLMLEGTRDYAIFLLDKRGRVASWNAGAERVKGYRADEIIGKHFSRFYPSEDVRRGRPQRQLKAARVAGRVEDEGWRVHKSGSRFWGSGIITALYDESRRLTGYLKLTRDFTQQRRAEEKLRTSQKHLQDFFEQAPFGLFWIGPTGRIRNVNKAGLDLLGCQFGECLKLSIQQLHTDPKRAADILQRIRRGETIQNQHARLRCPDGSIRDTIVEVSGLREAGRLVQSRWFVRDITRRRALEHEVLIAAERERRRLGRDLHDDLCQQLTGIEFLSQTLAGQLSAHSPTHQRRIREIARMVRAAIVRARELARGLAPMELERLGLEGALANLAASARRMFNVGCSLRCSIFRRSLKPELSIHLYRIAQEAISNSVRHGRAKRIVIRLTQYRRDLVLAVQDDGVGLPKSAVTNEGMGLRLMQYRADVLEGTLKVLRNPRGGTTVRCTVPNAFSQAESK